MPSPSQSGQEFQMLPLPLTKPPPPMLATPQPVELANVEVPVVAEHSVPTFRNWQLLTKLVAPLRA